MEEENGTIPLPDPREAAGMKLLYKNWGRECIYIIQAWKTISVKAHENKVPLSPQTIHVVFPLLCFPDSPWTWVHVNMIWAPSGLHEAKMEKLFFIANIYTSHYLKASTYSCSFNFHRKYN